MSDTVWLAPPCESQIAQFNLFVNVGNARIKIKFNRYDNVRVYNDAHNRCCGRIGRHDVDCGPGNKRQRIPPQQQPALRHPPQVSAPREAMAEAVCEACAPEIDASGKLMGAKAQQKLCNAWVYRVVGCREPDCRWFPCVADRVQHPRAAEIRAQHGF